MMIFCPHPNALVFGLACKVSGMIVNLLGGDVSAEAFEGEVVVKVIDGLRNIVAILVRVTR